MVREEARGLSRQRGALAAVIAGAPATTLAGAGASAFPGESALLGAVEVVRLGKSAVVALAADIGALSGSLVSGVITLPEHLGVVEFEEVELVVVGLRRGNKA